MWISHGTYVARILASLFGGMTIGLLCCAFSSLVLVRRIKKLQSRVSTLQQRLETANRERAGGVSIAMTHDEPIPGNLEEAGALLGSAYRATSDSFAFVMKPIGGKLWVMKERARVELRDLLSTPEALGAVRLSDDGVEPLTLSAGASDSTQQPEKAGTSPEMAV